MKLKYNYIAIEGNIGSGKTSLAKMISRDFNTSLILEQFEDNFFLPKFYNNPEKFAFPLEISFLSERYHQLKERLLNQNISKSATVSDYFIDKSLIFAGKTLQKEEFELFFKLFTIINFSIPKPDIILFLNNTVENLKKNIQERGRNYEKKMSDGYLEKIQSGYLDYFKQNKLSRVIIIDTCKMDFVNKKSDYYKITNILNQNYNPGIHKITITN